MKRTLDLALTVLIMPLFLVGILVLGHELRKDLGVDE